MCCVTGSRSFPSSSRSSVEGNRRYYQRQDVILIRQIKSLLYEEGFTIGGARQKLSGKDKEEDSTKGRDQLQRVEAGDQGSGKPDSKLLIGSKISKPAVCRLLNSWSCDFASCARIAPAYSVLAGF